VRRAADDRGAVLVEFMLVFPILCMFLFGSVSGALAWNQHLALSHGARQAARYGATLPTKNFGSLDLYLDAVAARAISNAEKNLDNGVAGRQVCVAYVYKPSDTGGDGLLDRVRSRTVNAAGTVTYSSTPCYSDGLAETDRRVQVDVQRGGTFDAIFVHMNLTLHEKASFIYEVAYGL
jgi:Flp pilus assembly protein TadG